MTRLTAFSTEDDAVLRCVRECIHPEFCVVVPDLQTLVERVRVKRTSQLDLLGHGRDGFMEFGSIVIDKGVFGVFSSLADEGVATIRLLGCKIASTSDPQEAVDKLNTIQNLLVLPSRKELRCKDYGHDGLRLSAETSVFDTAPDNATDSTFRISRLLRDPFATPAEAPRTLSEEAVTALESLLAPNYRACCPPQLAAELFTFGIERGIGVARIGLDRNDALVVLAGVGVDHQVTYQVNDPTRLRALVDQWIRNETPA